MLLATRGGVATNSGGGPFAGDTDCALVIVVLPWLPLARRQRRGGRTPRPHECPEGFQTPAPARLR
eukprot:8976987-Prorocentrum_lima.AAC.1